MAGKGSGAKRLGQPTLTAADWAQAALQLIAEAGLGALTVEALAARLGVTKGSFYWHFSGRSDLLAAALAEAAEDPVVRRALNRVASARIEYLEACYRDLGLAQPLAKAKAVFAYAAYRGLLQLAHEAPAVLPTDWSPYPTVVREALGPMPRAKRGRGR